MTPEERELVLGLVRGPRRPPRLAPDEFLQRFGAKDGVALGLGLLRDAVKRSDAIDVEWSLVVCFKFGFTDEHVGPLLILAYADWHRKHEDVARALGKLGSPTSVDALVHLAEWVPEYLEFDDFRALATKAIWALGGIRDDAAREALESLTNSENSIVANGAVAQLQR